MNGNNTDKLRSFRILAALILLGVAALLIGAGRLGDSMITRQAEQEAAHTRWQAAVEQLLHQEKGNPQAKNLRSLAVRHPEYILQTLQTGMRPEPRE
ncbi:MAG: hypothetical protein IKO93_19150 [Lentisphaeria bacterium]|nr:hypothetical protein [Lentisphaeria bacterium]